MYDTSRDASINSCIPSSSKERFVFYKSGDCVSLTCRIDHSEGLHDISLIGEVLSPSVKTLRAFTQGFGMEGPSCMVTVGSGRAVSHGLIALCGEHSSLFSYVQDHTTFSTRFTIQKRTTLFDEPVTAFQAGFNLENAASGPVTLPALFFFEKEEKDPQNGLRECAGKIAAFMNARHTMPPAFHWCSWYYHYQNFTQKHLLLSPSKNVIRYVSSFKSGKSFLLIPAPPF